jgi:signal recognition particle subunit SRP54
MLESLSERLEGIFKGLRSRGYLRPEDIEATLREVRLALLEADVNFRVVKGFVGRIRERAAGQEVLQSLSPAQQVIKIVKEELTELLGGSQARLTLSPNPPTVFMMVGLHGSGKTTTAAKLALMYRRQGRRPMLVALDLRRPAAEEQLRTLGAQVDVPVALAEGLREPAQVAQKALKEARAGGRDILIMDTAGRLHVDEALMRELRQIREACAPHEVLLVADAMTGQEAVNIAQRFDQEVGLTGVVLTKMDGDARGGAALSIKAVTGKPIKLIGVGEKLEALEPFHPERLASRVLGMGDVLTLIEKAQSAYEEQEAERLAKRLLREEFTFEDLREQLRKLRQMGPLENLLGMIPGMGKALKGVQVDEKELVKVEAIINSMTPEERRNHNLLNSSRKRRIAMGSGTSVADVNRVLKQYLQMRQMLKALKKGRGLRLPKILPF